MEIHKYICDRCRAEFVTPYWEFGLTNHQNFTSDWNLNIEYKYRNLAEYIRLIENSKTDRKESIIRCINLWLKENNLSLERANKGKTYVSVHV